jgi:uncharacterized membrane protein
MRSSRLKLFPLSAVLLVAASLLYPAIVYFGRTIVLAVKGYPAAISLAAAIVFGATLFRPPSMIERFARLREPELPPAARSYCRKVTIVWTIWLSANTIISAVLAIPGNDAAWALWTGLVAYMIMGALFAGEIAVRRILLGTPAKT